MKKNTILFAAVSIMGLVLSACGAGTPTPTEVSIAGVYTLVAQTLTVQAGEVADTDTPMPTDTPAIALTPTSTPTLGALPGISVATSPSGLCENSAYVSDVSFTDNTLVLPGQTMIKTWKMQNTGTCAWSSDYSLVFVSGTQMDGSTTTI
ncbi:MAG TPA: NBR1-Ig-like domain-containing protein, partial [Longilinea sp.]|nr:NBR1-Ig-like domain-containing protein [Longilinea sp.]